jgi:tRNA-uridine 2-sulfurtransferase
MSGGVDSSVAAVLLKEAGHDVTGVTMKIWDGSTNEKYEGSHACFGPDEEEDIKKAREVCEQIGIPFQEYELKEEYKRIVLDYFSREYLDGRTPNPCVLCNHRIKFGALISKILEKQVFDCFATGHYVRVGRDPGNARYLLRRGLDRGKDQSYFLYRLSQAQLQKCLFPLGELTKEQVRTIAHKNNLGFEEIPESQNFFEGDFTTLMNVGKQPGDIVDNTGRIMGRHEGYYRYTIGQRRGLGISHPVPLYVTGIDKENNRIIVGTKEEVYSSVLTASDLNWVGMEMPTGKMTVHAQIRSQHKAAPAVIEPLSETSVKVTFTEPQMAITPGQSVVFYNEDVVLGGGIIS